MYNITNEIKCPIQFKEPLILDYLKKECLHSYDCCIPFDFISSLLEIKYKTILYLLIKAY